MGREKHRLDAIRRAIGNALFMVGVVVLISGSWLASEAWLLASCLVGPVILFALAELIAPFSSEPRRSRGSRSVRL